MQQLLKKFEHIDLLKTTKNLLAFSGGVDSSALFYLLMENGIDFDIAIIDHCVRESSKDEVAYAFELAKQYNKKCFLKTVNLEVSNFEAKAREQRYLFFEKTIDENDYETLITAHHLGDKLEWFLMQLVRGAGAVELAGFSSYEQRNNYIIFRPLHEISKDELLCYLQKNSYKYFIDKSNFDEKYTRNKFRHNFSDPLLKEYKNGIIKSFRALEKDKNILLPHEYKKIDNFYLFKRDQNEIRLIAKILKFFKVVLTKKQRDEIEKELSCVVSSKIAIGKNDTHVFIAPYLQDLIMTKKFKEECRIKKIPKHVRKYMFKNDILQKM